MTLSLRERRRKQTAREIQIKTLEMALQRGLDDITTEEIAGAAGVSTRTFFNYYSNKEAAAIGAPPAFSKENLEALRRGKGKLAGDIKLFLNAHMEILAGDEDILKMIGTVLRSNEKARGILEGFLGTDHAELTECLCARVNNRQTATALASNSTDAIGRAIFLWQSEQDLSLNAAFDIIWDGQIAAAHILTGSSD